MTGPAERADGADAVNVCRVLGVAAQAGARVAGIAPPDIEGLAALLPLLGGEGEPIEPPDHVEDGIGTELLAAAHRAPTAGPGALGELHQSLLDDGHRRRHGVHYTPSAVADLLVDRTLGRAPRRSHRQVPLVCDPSCGGGVFLLAVADHLRHAGAEVIDVVTGALHGLDLDPLAVDVARTELVLWAAGEGLSGDRLLTAARALCTNVRPGDALVEQWPGEGRLDAVIGNPPFAGQLSRATARDAAGARTARALLGSAAGYADTAGLFLVRGVQATAPGGRVALLQPLSFLGARHAGAVRRRLTEQARLEEVWFPDRQVFAAAVDVCAPVLRVTAERGRPSAGVTEEPEPSAAPSPGTAAEGSVAVTVGETAEPRAVVDSSRLARAGSWSPVVAAADGVPLVELHGRPLVGRWATATAGFRDEFYALVPFVDELGGDPSTGGPPGAIPAAPFPPLPPGRARLVTSGLIEPGRTVWGEHPTRFAGRRLRAPVVDVAALRRTAGDSGGDRRLSVWADARLVPKVVVAAQTRVVEVAVDEEGEWWPSVPVISVLPALSPAQLDDTDEDSQRAPLGLWMLAAALAAPPITAWAAERAAGTALGRHAVKLSARQIAEVPLPVDREAWTAGSAELRLVSTATSDVDRAGHLAAAGRLLTAAHDLPSATATQVLSWWSARAGLPPEPAA